MFATQTVLLRSPEIASAVFSRRGDFDALFEGFPALRAITYVASPDLLLDLLDKKGFTRIEIIVGESLTESYRKELAARPVDTTDRLCQRVEDGSLKILVPEKTIHTKLYLLDKGEITRAIITSANLTETAQRASRQTNYAWYCDLPWGDTWLEKIEKDFATHKKGCSEFLGDLSELIRDKTGQDRKEIIEAWLRGTAVDQTERRTSVTLQQLTSNALDQAVAPVDEQKLVVVRLPENSHSRAQVEKFLAPIQPAIAAGEARVAGPAVIKYVEESFGVPLMKVDTKKGEILLGVAGRVVNRASPLPEPAEVSRGLEHLERYVSTVEWGQALDLAFARTSMYEAILYMFAAPFAHEQMKIMRGAFGSIDLRGPRYLYLFGPSQNGKTTFLRFALKLISGSNVQPLPASDLTKTKTRSVAALGTSFPLAFDDIVPSTRANFDEILKSYWEVWWNAETVAPQMVMTSNTPSLREWAKSRIKRIDFDVHFSATAAHKQQLNQLFETPNDLFSWFATLYMNELRSGPTIADDQLRLAREVCLRLYEHAGRTVPAYFPHLPLEQLYDPGQRAWIMLIDRLRKAIVRSEGERLIVEFSDDMQLNDVNEYATMLPQSVKSTRKGRALVIDNPSAFWTWLRGNSRSSNGRISATLRRFLGRQVG